jgi:hypothetical protein
VCHLHDERGGPGLLPDRAGLQHPDALTHSLKIGDDVDIEVEDIVAFRIQYEGKSAFSSPRFSWEA